MRRKPSIELKTKEELIELASCYLKIYVLGLPAGAVYNWGNALLSAVGDTKRPLIYLSFAARFFFKTTAALCMTIAKFSSMNSASVSAIAYTVPINSLVYCVRISGHYKFSKPFSGHVYDSSALMIQYSTPYIFHQHIS